MIILVGYMGSGKSTVGKYVARSMDLPFIDLDTYLEKVENMSVTQLFEIHGEDYFRNLEKHHFLELIKGPQAIISLGGGTPTIPEVSEALETIKLSVYLEASPEFLYSRLISSKSSRPLIANLPDDELLPFISSHLAARVPYYQKCSLHLKLPMNKQLIYQSVRKAYQ